MSPIKVVGLYTYPVKGMQGMSHKDVVSVTARGLDMDRRFMLVDPDGRFISQRECPELAAHSAQIVRIKRVEHLKIQGKEWTWMAPIPLFDWNRDKRILATVWGDSVEAVVQGNEVNTLLSDSLRRPVRLVYMPFLTERLSRGQRTKDERVLNSFADGFPFLLTSVESLADVNRHIMKGGGSPVWMDRFRPNIVVSGCKEAFEEETWRVFGINEVRFYGMKRCARCDVTKIDQKTGEYTGEEPFQTLTKHRRARFGMNLNHENTGLIQVGDLVEVIERGAPFIEK